MRVRACEGGRCNFARRAPLSSFSALHTCRVKDWTCQLRSAGSWWRGGSKQRLSSPEEVFSGTVGARAVDCARCLRRADTDTSDEEIVHVCNVKSQVDLDVAVTLEEDSRLVEGARPLRPASPYCRQSRPLGWEHNRLHRPLRHATPYHYS